MKILPYQYKLLLCILLILSTNALKAIEGFSLISAGAFTMGDSLDGIYDAPTRTVTLDAFYIGKHEVTKAEWDEVRNWGLRNGYIDLATGSGEASNHPVQTITWHDMVKWCNARSEKEGFKPLYYTNGAKMMIYRTGVVDLTNAHVNWNANGYRLPTEAEWEKAARGGLDGKRFPWGDTISHDDANYFGHPNHANFTSPFGSFPANNYGLYDVAGNVWEACWDRYGKLDSVDQINPIGPDSGAYRVFRGGSWANAASFCSVSFRSSDNPKNPANNYGFRVVRKQTIDGDYVGNFSAAKAVIAQAVHDYSGQLELKVSDSGAFSGSLVICGIRLGIKGKFDDHRFAEIDIMPNQKKRIAGASVQLLIETMNDNEYQVAAKMVWPDQPMTPFDCYPVAFTGKGGDQNFPLGGKQINSLLESQSVSGIDFGHGFMMIKASNDGTLKFTGRAADGSAITGTTRLVKDAFGDILAPVSFPLSAVKGLLHGVAEINPNPEEGQYDLSSPVEWIWVRLPQARAKTYKDGFAEKLGVYGQVWSFKKGESALPEAEGGFTFQVDPDSVLLEEPLELSGTWPSSNKPTWTGAPKGFTFKVNTATGQINGAVPRTINGKAAKALSYQGLLVKPGLDTFDDGALMGGGYILGTESSGVVELTAP